MELKTLKNLSNQPIWVVFKGRQIVIPAGEVNDVDVEVAKLFLEKFEELGVLEEVSEIGSVYDTKASNEVWVANITGDLDAPPEIDVKRSEKGRWYVMKVPNPLKDPYVVTRTMKGGMKEVIGKSGLEGMNLLPVAIKVPPYRRVKLPPHVAKWFLQRVAMSGVKDCIKSRAPSEFEPDSTWAINDLRTYLQLIDPTVDGGQLGPMEYKIRAKSYGSGEGGRRNLQKALREAKDRLLKRIFRRVFDPKYRLPTKAEFLAMKEPVEVPSAEGSESSAPSSGEEQASA